MLKKIALNLLLVFFLSLFCTAQQNVARKTYIIDGEPMAAISQILPNDFKRQLMDSIIIDQINSILYERDCEPLIYKPLMFTIAREQSEYMAMMADEDPNAKLKNTIAARMEAYGGSSEAAELTTKINVMKGKVNLTYYEMAEELVFRWMSNSRSAALFESTNYQYIGASSNIDLEGKRVYVSVVLGNFRSFNEGMRNRDMLKVPYTIKNNGLDNYDPEVCKRINRMTNLNELRDALVVEGREVFIDVENVKTLQKIMRNKNDALALDILQKEQYDCKFERNILDYNRFNRGVMTKPYKSKKILKKNLIKTTGKSKAFKGKVADLPENIDLNESEINLLIIQDGAVCTSVPKTFIHPIKGTYKNNVKMLADTLAFNTKFGVYKPIPDSADLEFVIPFKGNKADYNEADIEPFLEALEQRDFHILNMTITAYSSVEGSDSVNRNLQRRRAESIVRALEKRQFDSTRTEIITDYNWADFVTDIRSTKYSHLAKLPIERVQDSILKNNLAKELEPILQKHRFARIQMRIVYDITGKNEQPFMFRKFKEACDSSDRILALSIQKYIMRRIMKGEYPESAINDMQIPDEPDFAGLAMNKLWLRYRLGQIKETDMKEPIEQLAVLNPQNEYIAFNNLLMHVNYPEGLFKDIGPRLQSGIDRLYYTPLQKRAVDGLNLRLQLKTISEVDSVTHVRATKTACVERIKSIVDIKAVSMENSLKLAELFLDNKDYMLTIKTLEPWAAQTTNMQLLLTYVSLCSLFENEMHTAAFDAAMERIRQIEPETYCKLLNGKDEGFSLRVFENESVKAGYCESCAGAKGK
ncbi:MAG: hypothetical protein IJ911_13235 [Salinivirgaceae bacterium]|nr:hypothetical protein [Salinivirgaceae bacterium]